MKWGEQQGGPAFPGTHVGVAIVDESGTIIGWHKPEDVRHKQLLDALARIEALLETLVAKAT